MAEKDTSSFIERGRPLSPVLSKIILQAEEDFVEFYDVSSSYARKMIAGLVDKGWLVRVGRGQYQLQPAKTGLDPYPSADKFVTAGQLSRNGFIAFGSAAEYHGLTTQVFQSVFVATTGRTRSRKSPPVPIEYIHVASENFLGFKPSTKAPDVQMATVERTLIDAIDRPELCGGISDIAEIFKRGCQRADADKILEYLPSYHSKSLTQKVGYMLENFGCKVTHQQMQKLQKWSDGNYAYLFGRNKPGLSAHQQYNNKWRLVINAPGFEGKEQADQ
jgi:predicted transcriptional regulator of viral defense system